MDFFSERFFNMISKLEQKYSKYGFDEEKNDPLSDSNQQQPLSYSLHRDLTLDEHCRMLSTFESSSQLKQCNHSDRSSLQYKVKRKKVKIKKNNIRKIHSNFSISDEVSDSDNDGDEFRNIESSSNYCYPQINLLKNDSLKVKNATVNIVDILRSQSKSPKMHSKNLYCIENGNASCLITTETPFLKKCSKLFSTPSVDIFNSVKNSYELVPFMKKSSRILYGSYTTKLSPNPRLAMSIRPRYCSTPKNHSIF